MLRLLGCRAVRNNGACFVRQFCRIEPSSTRCRAIWFVLKCRLGKWLAHVRLPGDSILGQVLKYAAPPNSSLKPTAGPGFAAAEHYLLVGAAAANRSRRMHSLVAA